MLFIVGHYCWVFILFWGMFLRGMAQGRLCWNNLAFFVSLWCLSDYWNKHSAFSAYSGKTGKSLAGCPCRGECSWASYYWSTSIQILFIKSTVCLKWLVPEMAWRPKQFRNLAPGFLMVLTESLRSGSLQILFALVAEYSASLARGIPRCHTYLGTRYNVGTT